MLTTLLSFIVVLGVLVFLHELGHFALAKRAGVHVETFSLGFGPRLFGFKRGETDYRVCAIPLGGYVKMVGEDPTAEDADQQDSFAMKSVWARMKIVLAGPLMNLALPFLLMPMVYLLGIDQPRYLSEPAVVSWVVPDSPGREAGFLAGDTIRRIQGQEVSDWQSTLLQFAANVEKRLQVEVLRGNETVQIEFTPLPTGWGAPYTGLLQEMPPVVGALESGSPAQEAGLRAGDRITALNDDPITHWEQMSGIIRSHPDQSLRLTFQREEEARTVQITPAAVRLTEEGRLRKTFRALLEKLGVETRPETDAAAPVVGQIGVRYLTPTVVVKYGLWDSVKNGVVHIGEIVSLTFEVLGKLVTGNLSPKTLGGPIIIAKMTGDAARLGLASLLSFMALLSLQLGILNLLPIPVLDGGHVLFLSLEAALRKPVSLRVREIAQQAGFVLLIGFFLYISYNDVMRLIP